MPILYWPGIVGFAISFAAQSLIKDLVNGPLNIRDINSGLYPSTIRALRQSYLWLNRDIDEEQPFPLILLKETRRR